MAQKGTDFSAALTGLVMGAAIMFLLVFAIVTLTNQKYAGHGIPSHTTTPATSSH